MTARPSSSPSTARRPRVVVAAGTLDGTLLDAEDWPAGYRHGETLLPAIDALLGRLGIERDGLAAIVVGTGPGAFTGLRVGIATAKGDGPRAWPADHRHLDRRGAAVGRRRRCGPAPAGWPVGPARRPARDARAGCWSVTTMRASRPTRPSLPSTCRDARRPTRSSAARPPGRAGRRACSRIGAARLAAGDIDDLARLVPDYVTLPRGVRTDARGGVVVARPPMILRIEPMRIEDLPAVHAIEKASFEAPWPPEAYRNDLETNRLAQYLVARIGDEIAAYGGMWLMVDEGHIITFAVHPDWRRQRIGERLLLAFLDLASDRGAHEATLEVRLSNLPARRLYEKFGFRPVGLRPRYYSDNGEDALIMTTEPLADASMRERIARLRAAVDAAPAPSRPVVGRHVTVAR